MRGADAEEFRAVMRHFPTGVTVLTTIGPAGPHGMTANAVMSLSLHPPTALAAVNHETNTYAILRNASSFAINFLAADQEELAVLFARSNPREDPFDRVAWRPSPETGDPVLAASVAVLECRLEQRIPVADHSLMVGAVAGSYIHRPDAAPLVFTRGGFRTVTGSPLQHEEKDA
ncbi:flavin reductase family protein [Streptomyces buecherae]|uniref:Flavin reductase family protein n=1 Tax=Streptomyces buecherae TaxID=2763006 RepID=A0A7H8N5Q6_9ACTN|nr:flavin reductase family protein [Streptomyces buecherae]MBC3986357.1 flavin reductase family protein [Streptomyces buecherae]MBC3990491.1 flavin reductase family protein [Streptomyces buecherae]QKW49721.1 flavin reductase family protein [Streptomyces buecherae]